MNTMMRQMQPMQQTVQQQLNSPNAANATANIYRNQNGNPNVNDFLPLFENLPANHSRNEVEPRRSSLPVHKWPFKFSGDNKDQCLERKDLTAFFKKVNIFARSENTPVSEVFQRVIHLLDAPTRGIPLTAIVFKPGKS